MISLIKICGLSTPETLAVALDDGADLVGFVRFAPSPRHVSLETGRSLSDAARGRATRVVLLVDPTDGEFDEAVAAIAPDLVQLHGTESVERVRALAIRGGRPVMKAVGVAGPDDLARAALYKGAAARILLDAKPPRGATLPGGNGVAFDWSLLAGLEGVGLDLDRDVMLSGGLHSGNVADAVARTGVSALDVSSGVESRPGQKDPARIADFIRAARAALPPTTRRVA